MDEQGNPIEPSSMGGGGGMRPGGWAEMPEGFEDMMPEDFDGGSGGRGDRGGAQTANDDTVM